MSRHAPRTAAVAATARPLAFALAAALTLAGSAFAQVQVTYWHGFTGPDLPVMEGLVAEFNAARRQFPAVVFAGMFGFGTDKPFFDVGEADRATMTAAPPQVKF